MSSSHLARRASPSASTGSGNNFAPVSKTLPTATSSELNPACERQDTKSSSRSSPRTNFFRRVLSASSRKTSYGYAEPPESAVDHHGGALEKASSSSKNLKERAQQRKIKHQDSSSRGNLLQRILSLSTKNSGRSSCAGEPNICLVPPNYNRAFRYRTMPPVLFTAGQWADELVAQADNGIRAEISDMYAMFANVEMRPTMLTLADVDLYVHWFRTFLNVLREFFDLEEACLFPWVEGVDSLSNERRLWETDTGRVTGQLCEARRLKKKGHLIRLGTEIEDCTKLFERKPVAEGLPSLADLVDQFVSHLMDYIETKERELPPIIYRHLKLRDRPRFEKKYWATAQCYENHAISIVVATGWMDNRQQRSWRRRILGIGGKTTYNKWVHACEVNHSFVVKEFARRVSLAQEERLAQIHENDIARARAQAQVEAYETADQSGTEGRSVVSSTCASDAQRSCNLHELLHSAQQSVI